MELLASRNSSTCYRHHTAGPVDVLVSSTPATRRLLTSPHLVGDQYSQALRTGVRDALSMAVAEIPDLRTALTRTRSEVLNILRGGLTFGVASAVEAVSGTPPMVGFIGTDRQAGALRIDYERWEDADGGALVLGDIVATGSTVDLALRTVLDRSARTGRRIPHIVVVTIAAAPGVAAIERLVNSYAATLPAPPRATVIALESIFRLPENGAAAEFPQAPFDFLRGTTATTPEFEWERLTTMGSLLEKCVVYDGGLRAFAPTGHLDFRAAWWTAFRPDTDLETLARVTAGLHHFALPFAEWRSVAAPATAGPGSDHERIYEAGRHSWESLRGGTVGRYLDDHEVLKQQ
ncbi:hypothetical protein [Actinoplanes awajinensis]|uniref:Phosphoribosyltransferase domain-containing protein n=1 Tax=Actinoplanes awajinensis subsp. mycoplanecinus TaxID=135947 RepID=A0A101JFA1_9ACTN|nr:hypothetical protein [Actinoplanes awajinensis]KUL25798.1 hypothetical protein ADL15_39470 [Actinoplanes awajinensis subsp. mycoplanecinus]